MMLILDRWLLHDAGTSSRSQSVSVTLSGPAFAIYSDQRFRCILTLLMTQAMLLIQFSCYSDPT